MAFCVLTGQNSQPINRLSYVINIIYRHLFILLPTYHTIKIKQIVLSILLEISQLALPQPKIDFLLNHGGPKSRMYRIYVTQSLVFGNSDLQTVIYNRQPHIFLGFYIQQLYAAQTKPATVHTSKRTSCHHTVSFINNVSSVSILDSFFCINSVADGQRIFS